MPKLVGRCLEQVGGSCNEPDWVIARRYAIALFELAREKGELDRVEQELYQVVETLERVPNPKEWLTAPAVDVERKKALIAERFQGFPRGRKPPVSPARPGKQG